MNTLVLTTAKCVAYGTVGTFTAAGIIAALPVFGAAGMVTLGGWATSAGVGAITSAAGLLSQRGRKSPSDTLRKSIEAEKAAGEERERKLNKLEAEKAEGDRKIQEGRIATENMLRFIRCLVAAAESDGPINSDEESEILKRSYSASLHCTEASARQEIKAALGSKIGAAEAWNERMKITNLGLRDALMPAIIAVIEIDVSGRRHPAEDAFISAWSTFEGTTRPDPDIGSAA